MFLASLMDIEKKILHWITCDWHVPGSASFLRFIQSEKVAVPLFVAALVFVSLKRRHDVLRCIAATALGLGVGALVGMLCWATVDRLRPPHHYDQLLRTEAELATCASFPDAFPVRNVVSTRPSFPSQHGLTMGGLVMGLWLLSRRIGVAALLFSLLVAYGRLYLGRHWPTDMIAGAVLGAVPTWLFWRHVPAIHGWLGIRHWVEPPGPG